MVCCLHLLPAQQQKHMWHVSGWLGQRASVWPGCCGSGASLCSLHCRKGSRRKPVRTLSGLVCLQGGLDAAQLCLHCLERSPARPQPHSSPERSSSGTESCSSTHCSVVSDAFTVPSWALAASRSDSSCARTLTSSWGRASCAGRQVTGYFECLRTIEASCSASDGRGPHLKALDVCVGSGLVWHCLARVLPLEALHCLQGGRKFSRERLRTGWPVPDQPKSQSDPCSRCLPSCYVAWPGHGPDNGH